MADKPNTPIPAKALASTPGPWREGQDGNNRVYGPDGAGEHSGLIAVVYKGRGNTRLTASAPDLLEAMEEIKELADSAPASTEVQMIWETARDAIAKAKGQP